MGTLGRRPPPPPTTPCTPSSFHWRTWLRSLCPPTYGLFLCLSFFYLGCVRFESRRWLTQMSLSGGLRQGGVGAGREDPEPSRGAAGTGQAWGLGGRRPAEVCLLHRCPAGRDTQEEQTRARQWTRRPFGCLEDQAGWRAEPCPQCSALGFSGHSKGTYYCYYSWRAPRVRSHAFCIG